MSQKSDAPRFILQAWMFLECRWITHIIQISIKNYLAIESHANPAPIGHNLFLVPLACRFQKACTRRDDIVDRAVMLFRFNFPFVSLMPIIEDLNFHALISGVTFERGTNSHAIVATRFGLELKPEDEVCILFFRIQIPTSVRRTNYCAVFHKIARSVAADKFPARQAFTVKQSNKTCFRSLWL